ncbi:MAG: DUF3109 family protein [Flavobacteriia bacterium]|jgi:hypothetical protein
MLIEVKDKVVSTLLFENKFVCDLNACKGACCIEGDSGAPIKLDEIDILEEDLEKIKPYMRQEGIDAVEKTGVFYMDRWDNEPVTTLVNGKECAFVYFDENNITKCAIEQAHKDGKTEFKKPISCHLYPIRVQKYSDFQALNYSEWDICKPACECGSKLDVKVYKFLREPIVRAFGQEFFDELELINSELEKKNDD